MAEEATRDFFISYASVDRPRAEWIAVELEKADYTTIVQSFDFRPGTDFVHQMHDAAERAKRAIAVLSPAYFGSRFGEAEWRAAFARTPMGRRACWSRSGSSQGIRSGCWPLGFTSTLSASTRLRHAASF